MQHSSLSDLTHSELLTYTSELQNQNSNLKKVINNPISDALFTNMSHEIRTTLKGIIGLANLMDEEELGIREYKKFAQTILKGGNDLLDLVNEVLDNSKIAAGKMALNMSSQDIHELILSNTELFQTSAVAKGLNYQVDLKIASKTYIKTDRIKLKQILNNLISNAIKFTKDGKISISAEIVEEQLNISVIDTGIGIASNMQDKVFDRYTQADSDTSLIYGGTGLGLSIARTLAQNMGGNIVLESYLQQGSTFTIQLPAKTESNTELAQTKDVDTNFDVSPLHLLIVEDQEINITYLSKVMSLLQLNYSIAKNGQEAVDMVLQTPNFDLILMDIEMPVMDGYQATEIIKEHHPDIPIIAHSAIDTEADKTRAYLAGCEGHLPKLFKPQELIQILQDQQTLEFS